MRPFHSLFILSFLSFAFLAAINIPLTIAQDKTITIATEAIYPPFNMRNQKGQAVGFDIDIINAICQRIQINCVIVIDSWQGIIRGMETGKYDAIINSMSITEERKKQYDFTEPYYSNKLAFIAKRELGGRLAEKANLKGKRIGVQTKTVSARYLAGIKGVVQVAEFETQEAAWEALRSDRVDAVMTDKLLGFAWLNTDARRKNYEFVGNDIDIHDKVGIAVNKNNPELVNNFNRGLKTILKDGSYAKINEKYFPFSIY